MFLVPDGFVVVSGTGPVEVCAIPAGFSRAPLWTDDSVFRKWNVSLRAGQSPCAGAKTRFPAENAKIPGLFPALNFQRTLLLLLADSAKIQQRSDWRGKCPIGKCPCGKCRLGKRPAIVCLTRCVVGGSSRCDSSRTLCCCRNTCRPLPRERVHQAHETTFSRAKTMHF